MPPTGELRVFLIYTRDEVHHQQVGSSITRWLQGALSLNLTLSPDWQETVSSCVKSPLYVVVYLGMGWSFMKVFRRRTKKINSPFHNKILSTGARFSTQPHIGGRWVELCSWAGGGHRRKLGPLFGMCNPFPKPSHTSLVCNPFHKRSHTSLLFHCSLSSSTQSSVSEQSYLFFCSVLSSVKPPFPFFFSSCCGSGQSQLGGHFAPCLQPCPAPAALWLSGNFANQGDEL